MPSMVPGDRSPRKRRGEDPCPAILRKVPTGGRGKKIVEALRGKGSVRMTTDEILALTREA